jgi:hypothetical protein
MMLSSKLVDINDKRNKIYIKTRYSQDGRELDGFWAEYNPEDKYALFLLTKALDASEMVEYYWVYDKNGVCERRERTKQH